MPVQRSIPMHLLDEPEVAMRTDISDDYLRELAADIEAKGLINPISVKREGERYRIAAGHCRYLAHKLLGRDHIDARDFTDDNVHSEALKISENLWRSDVSDADMATYLSDLQEKYHYDLETLMTLTRRSEDWIAKRLSLFNGDKRVFEALRGGHIKLGHALLLNRFPDQFRLQYLDTTVKSTPPVHVLAGWLDDLSRMGLDRMGDVPEAEHEHQPVTLPGVQVESCWICGGNNMPWTMVFPRVHQHCQDMVMKSMAETKE